MENKSNLQRAVELEFEKLNPANSEKEVEARKRIIDLVGFSEFDREMCPCHVLSVSPREGIERLNPFRWGTPESEVTVFARVLWCDPTRYGCTVGVYTDETGDVVVGCTLDGVPMVDGLCNKERINTIRKALSIFYGEYNQTLDSV